MQSQIRLVAFMCVAFYFKQQDEHQVNKYVAGKKAWEIKKASLRWPFLIIIFYLTLQQG